MRHFGFDRIEQKLVESDARHYGDQVKGLSGMIGLADIVLWLTSVVQKTQRQRRRDRTKAQPGYVIKVGGTLGNGDALLSLASNVLIVDGVIHTELQRQAGGFGG